jgi:hypothetical protein
MNILAKTSRHGDWRAARKRLSPERGVACGWSDTIILVNLPRGEPKVLIEAVDPEGRVLTAQTLTFKSPGK